MKLYTFVHQKQTRVGVALDGALLALPFAGMLELIRSGKPARALVAKMLRKTSAKTLIPFSRVKLLAPIPRPGKIWCSGLNYKSHVEENPSA